ncbi:MAG TPA: M28 family peptidase [Anaerolineales bacterium]|nr:M28 family peptidase [Anaerolineales bacterium]
MSTTIHHLQTLVGLGPRPIASPANQAAADYIRDIFCAAGLDVEEQPYAAMAWEHRSTFLEQGGKRLECTANAFSLPCDVTAPLVPVASLAELEAASVRGKILLLYGDLVRAPLAAKSWFLRDERDTHFFELLERKQPAAVLAPPTGTNYFCQLTEDWELDLPAATVPVDVALYLLCEPQLPIHLFIDARCLPATARNIVARTPRIPERRLVLCAHFDTKINTPGATDNAGGVAALLSLAERLPRDLPFGLEFIAFNGEEYLPLGDDEYIRRSEAYFGNILACINMDGAGAALGTNNITAVSCSLELETRIKSVAERFPGVVWVDPWPESNHSTFSFRGIPAIPLSSTGVRSIAHSVDDTLEQICPARLEEVGALVRELVEIFR